MKKPFFIITAAAAAVLLAGCARVREYGGEYVYSTKYGEYGAKVCVYVKGNRIERVEVIDADYPRVTASWEGSGAYLAGEQAFLDSFAGKTIAEVKTYSVVREGFVPSEVRAEGLSVVTGATQSTGRLLLAVQKALAKA